MRPRESRRPVRARRPTPIGSVPLALLTALLLLLTLGAGASADPRPRTPGGSSLAPGPAAGRGGPTGLDVDFRLTRTECGLLGRTWTGGGCSRVSCVRERDRITGGRNAETCLHGRHGFSYGQPIDARTCTELHRFFVAPVNWCASYPHRSAVSRADAAWCQAPYTSYVVDSEVPGAYDECLRPRRAAELARLAAHEGISLSQATLAHSRVQCQQRPGAVYADGRCQPTPPGTPSPAGGEVALVGDSVAWRGENELASIRPEWFQDSLPGRSINTLSDRLTAATSLAGPPAGVVIAVGANPSLDYRAADLRAAVSVLPTDAQIMFVLPYRQGPGGTLATRYDQWMRDIAAQRPRTCVAAWSDLAATHPHLLVDGVHPTGKGEQTWADLVSTTWDGCGTVAPGS